MSCFHPLPAYQEAGGKVKVGRSRSEAARGVTLELPCGMCIGCKQDRARSWALRCVHEASLYDANTFATLTYDDAHLPERWNLDYRDFQLFMKRLRKVVRGVTAVSGGHRPIRFFCAGEYGEQNHRPHFHALLFNCHFSDSVRYVNGTSRSALVERLWGAGNVVLGDVTPSSAAYVAGYVLSKRYGAAGEVAREVLDTRTGEVFSRRAEFCEMSLGIGREYYRRYSSDMFPHDFAVTKDGKRVKVPRYYWERFKAEADPFVVEGVRESRITRATDLDAEESSERRRCDREEVAWARVTEHSRRFV